MSAIVSVILAVIRALAGALPELSAGLVEQWGEGAEALRRERDAVTAERDRLRERVAALEAEATDMRERLRATESGRDALRRAGGGNAVSEL